MPDSLHENWYEVDTPQDLDCNTGVKIMTSKVGCSIFLEKFSELKKSHTGKFHSSPSLKQAYLTDMLQELIDTGYTVEPVLVNGNWCEIDTIQDIENARKNFRL